ncbi:MAG TPA: dTDP-glucose 4,6-dehydratase [Candidatus Eremiobacteraceae bacterium]|jgi:dTDP-glucose 4,6-dehydratase|nr:dTDP-glucose 4,6-dehydratase [Candidatus Eremiobacteraceae bacterium]
MKILVTGGAGFIGSNFIRVVLGSGKGYSVVNFDKLTYAGNLANLESIADNPRYSFIRGDICDAAAVEAAVQGCDAVVHFAAESHVDRSIYEPAASIETNVKGTFVLLQVARKQSISRFLHISTDEVYGDIEPGKFADENSPIQPSSPYSSSKASSDLLVKSYVRTYGFPALITRSSNNYGPYQFPEKFLPLMITNALDNKPLPIYGDGKQERDWLHVEDNCKGVLAVLERGRIGEVYNLGGSDIVENLTIARQLLRLIGKPENLLSYVKDRPGHDRRYALKCDKVERELSWKPLITLEDGFRQTIDWYRTNTAWMAGVRGGDYLNYYQKYYENRDSSLHAIADSGRGSRR